MGEASDSRAAKPSSRKLPFYRNVIAILIIVEAAIAFMYLIDSLLLWLSWNGEGSAGGDESVYTSHADHIINLQMIAVGGAVAMFERLIPARKQNGGDD